MVRQPKAEETFGAEPWGGTWETVENADENLLRLLCFFTVTYSKPGQCCLHWPYAQDSQFKWHVLVYWRQPRNPPKEKDRTSSQIIHFLKPDKCLHVVTIQTEQLSYMDSNMVIFRRGRHETRGNSPCGHRAIYTGDDTWAGNIKECLKEACGSDVKRQVVDLM